MLESMRLILLAAALLSVGAAGSTPEGLRLGTPAGPAGRAPTGRLSAVGAAEGRRVHLGGGEFVIGSGSADLREAVRQCMLDTRDECRADRFSDEGPSRRIRLAAFGMDRTEVSVRDYRGCVEAGACTVPDPIAFDSRFSAEDQPVVGVSWDAALRYCEVQGGRLPTEAEWEYAARGPNGRLYPWGDRYNPALCNHGRVEDSNSESGREMWWLDSADGFAYTAPVGSFPAGASPFGLLDLAGNVAEWTADWYSEQGYAVLRRFAPLGPPTGSLRVVRGGSWRHPPFRLRAAARLAVAPSLTSAELGFRCAYDR